MGKCCIPNCRNSRERIPGLTFHQIPSNEPCRSLWMEVLAEHGVDAFTEWTLVCGDHFTHQDYKMTARKNFLLPTAVPSVFTVTPCKNLPRKRGRKPKALLQQQQQQQAAQARRVTVLRTVVEDEDGQLRRTGRQRKQKLFTDMLLYMPTTEEGQNADRDDDDDDVSDAEEPSGLGPPDELGLEEASQDAGTEPNGDDDEGAKQPAKNVNVIVFTNQPRPAASSGIETSERPPKRRCCQIQAQRLLFYRSVITKLRKRVLSLEACLADRDRELALLEAGKEDVQ